MNNFKELKNEELELLQKELKESKFVIVCTEKTVWLYGNSALLALGICRIIENYKELNK